MGAGGFKGGDLLFEFLNMPFFALSKGALTVKG